jgi:hypothetical protein
MDKSRNETTATSVLRYHRQYLATEARCSHAGQGKKELHKEELDSHSLM